MADENEVLENTEAVAETAASTPEITGDFDFNYSRIENISGIVIPEDGSMSDCKSIVELAAMAYNMSNKQTAYNKAAFQKYMLVINSIVGKYNNRISANEDHLVKHDGEIEELQKLVGNLDLDSTTSLIEATKKLVKALFDDDNYQDNFEAGDGGIIANHRDRIVALEKEEKVSYKYSGDDDIKTHKVALKHTQEKADLENEDVENNQTEIYTAAATDALISKAIEDNLTNETSSVGKSSDGDKYIKGQVATSGLTAVTAENNTSSYTADNPNHLMSEEAILETLNNLLDVLEARDAKLKKMAEDFAKFQAALSLKNAEINNGELYYVRHDGTFKFHNDNDTGYGVTLTIGDYIEIGTTKYYKVNYSYKPCDQLWMTFECYIPEGDSLITDAKSSNNLIPLEIFYGGKLNFDTLTTANNNYYLSTNIVYYCPDKSQSYITNGTTNPDVFAAQGIQGEQGFQGVGIKDITAKSPVSTESGATNTYTITLKDPKNGATSTKEFSVTNGFGFRYIGNLTTSQADSLPTLGGEYTSAVTSGWDLPAPKGKLVQINDYVVLTDDTGYEIRVFNGTAWQQMIKGEAGADGKDGKQIIPVYADDGEYFRMLGHIEDASEWTENNIKAFTKAAQCAIKSSSVTATFCHSTAVYPGIETDSDNIGTKAIIFKTTSDVEEHKTGD